MLKVQGERELQRTLQRLGWGASRKAIYKANSKAIRPVVQSAKSNVRRTSKTVAKGIGVRHKAYPRKGNVVSVVGVRNDTKLVQERPHINPFNDQWMYRKHDPRKTAHLIEGGTKAHQIVVFGRLKINHPGTSPKPFLEPALERNQNKVIALHAQILRQELERAARAK